MDGPAKRKYIIGGNWKCNGTLSSINTLVNDTLNKAEFDTGKVEVVVAPVSIHIATVKALVKDTVKVAAQNMSQTGKGAFTGEISGDQLKDFDVNWVIIGHSERRHLYEESDAIVAEKAAKAQEIGLNSIICIGEQLAEREAGTTNKVLETQLNGFKASIKDWSIFIYM